jgi:hypothetical protein
METTHFIKDIIMKKFLILAFVSSLACAASQIQPQEVLISGETISSNVSTIWSFTLSTIISSTDSSATIEIPYEKIGADPCNLGKSDTAVNLSIKYPEGYTIELGGGVGNWAWRNLQDKPGIFTGIGTTKNCSKLHVTFFKRNK